MSNLACCHVCQTEGRYGWSGQAPELVGASKRRRLAWWYEQDAAYGDRSAAAAVAKRLAPVVDLSEGTARAYIAQILADLEKEGEAS